MSGPEEPKRQWTRVKDYLRRNRPVDEILADIQGATWYDEWRKLEERAYESKNNVVITESEFKEVQHDVEQHVLVRFSESIRQMKARDSVEREYNTVIGLFGVEGRIAKEARRLADEHINRLERGT